jgi:hypothetical protein
MDFSKKKYNAYIFVWKIGMIGMKHHKHMQDIIFRPKIGGFWLCT